jgi:hypothetical protein
VSQTSLDRTVTARKTKRHTDRSSSRIHAANRYRIGMWVALASIADDVYGAEQRLHRPRCFGKRLATARDAAHAAC